jgi:hypothetical protein
MYRKYEVEVNRMLSVSIRKYDNVYFMSLTRGIAHSTLSPE